MHMRVDPASVLQPDGQSGRSPFAAQWRSALPILLATIAAIILIHWRTFQSIVAIWERSETFAHGFLIAPISIALIWMKRREVANLRPSVDYLGFALLAAAGLVWLVSHAGQVQVIAQYAVVAMIPAAVIAVCGRQVAGALAFPLAFLLLGVPIGEGLIPPLMDLTADFTVAALRFTGIPVFREGNFFTIPSGSWSVVEGCSGVRYLIASITVGTLFAYLNYRLLWKRVLFIALSVIVPLVANWLRAYMIVMIGHLSDGKLAHGVDHLIYGWVFFGIVMMLLFWIGSFWRDDLEPRDVSAPTSGPTPAVASAVAARSSGIWLTSTAIITIGLVAVWPLYAAHFDRDVVMPAQLRIEAPAPANGWVIDNASMTDWRPRYEGAATSLFDVYRKGDATVALYLGYYPSQRDGAELVTSTNIMVVQKHPVWSKPRRLEPGRRRRQRILRHSGDEAAVALAAPVGVGLVPNRGARPDEPVSRKVAVRARQAPRSWRRRRCDHSGDAVRGRHRRGRTNLRSFARDMLPSVNASLAQVSARVRSDR